MNKNITVAVETISPMQAAEYLLNKSENRPIHEKWVNLYAYYMREGKWRINAANPITFSDDGILLDGQHRLTAITRAKRPITMTVVRGADKDDFAVMDTGLSRSGADVLALKGYANNKVIAAIIKAYLSIKKGYMPIQDGTADYKIRTFISNEDILQEYETAPDLYQTIFKLAKREYEKYRLFTTTQFGYVATILVKEKHHDLAKVEEFFRAVNDGSQYPYLTYLRKKISSSMRRTTDKDKLSGIAKMVMLSKAWNYFINGEDRKQILYRIGDKINFE